MDPFTQRMMERARMRREKIDSELVAVGLTDSKRRRTPLIETNPAVVATSPCKTDIIKPQEDQIKSTPSPIKVNPNSPAKPEECDLEENENIDHSRDLRTRLNRLGKLYAGPENLDIMSSPVHHRTETLSRYRSDVPAAPPVKSAARSARLAALAKSIEEWEDDLTNLTPASEKFSVQATKSAPAATSFRGHLGSPAKSNLLSSPSKMQLTSPSRLGSKSPARLTVSNPMSSPLKSTICSPSRASPQTVSSVVSPRGVQMGSRALQTTKSPVRVTSFVRKETKTVVWDKAVIATLESQGFVATKSRSRLVYDYEKNSRSLQEEDNQQLEEQKVEEVRMDEVLGGDGVVDNPQDPQDEDVEDDENDLGCSSPATGSVSSPGWVYRAGSPMKKQDASQLRGSPRMGLQSPVKRVITSSQLGATSPVKTSTQSPVKQRTPNKAANKNMSPGSVLHRAAMFESAVMNTNSPSKDPAELPLLQRMALFEKNKSQEPLLPKVAFSTPLPAKLMPKKSSTNAISKPIAKPVEKKAEAPKKEPMPIKPPATGIPSKVLAQKAMFEKSLQQAPKRTEVVAASQNERQQELEMLRNRWDKQKQLAKTPVVNTPHQERKDMERQRQRWDSGKSHPVEHKNLSGTPPPPPPPMPDLSSPVMATPASSPTKSRKSPSPVKEYPVLETVRKIRVSPPKQGRMYPCLSDIDATESEMDADTSGSTDHSGDASDEGNTSFGTEILQAAGLQRDRSIKRAATEMTASECAVLNEIDEFLDEALGSDSESVSVGPTPPKKSREVQMAEEFQFRTPAAREVTTPAQNILSCVEESGQAVPLVHTVSFYRKQQAKGSKLATPVRQVTRLPESDEDSDECPSPDRDQHMVQRKISQLCEEVSKQQIVISQASQAVNLCRQTVEFSNSSEQVEAERLLLVASNKRQAALHEIERLKVEGTLHAHGDHTETGSLNISHLALPLKKEFLDRARRTDGEAFHKPDPPTPEFPNSLGSLLSLKFAFKLKQTQDNAEQYIVCLVRCQEHVLASPMLAISSVPPQQHTLRFPGSLNLSNLSTDFTVKVEVYTLQARRETISHEDKYHIKKDANKLRLTPKKQKHDSLLVMPVVQSPAGPSAVRTTSFVLSGYTVFSLREINRTHFTLNKVPFNSPLEGHIGMQLSCELHLDTEQRGFLTMFEDITGFGAWHRRWCVLDGSRLSYWKYPDDEKKKEPIGWLDLNSSCTKQVGAVSRDVCARPNTFLLETRRAPQPDDRESLVMIPGQQFTILRHLLSADTRDERIQWCNELNRALFSMRAWRSSASQQTCVATSL